MLLLNPLNESAWAFPLLECIHISAIVCGVGTAALVNLRLLGVGLNRNTATELWRETMPWTLGGLSLAIFSGLLLFSIDPKMYVANSAFRFKMVCLVLAIVFYFTMVRGAAASGTPGRTGSIIAYISLALWTLVPFGGIFIGFMGSAYAYPALLSLHIVGLVLLGGMVVVTNLRLLGLGMRSYSVSDVVNGLRGPKWIAFIAAAICGVLMFGAKAEQYSNNPWFWIKGALLVSVAINYLAFRSGKPKLSAGLSLLLWTGVVFAGRGPATIKDIMHSMVDPSGDFLFQSVEMISDEHGIREKAPQTAAEWDEVGQHLTALLEAPALLTTPGRRAARLRDRSKNPQVESEPEEIQKLLDAERPDFIRRAQRLNQAASVAMKAVEAKDKDALLLALDGIDKACESCHLHYWYPKDKKAQEAAKQSGIIE